MSNRIITISREFGSGGSNAIKLTRNFQTRRRGNCQQGQTREGEVIAGAVVLGKCA